MKPNKYAFCLFPRSPVTWRLGSRFSPSFPTLTFRGTFPFFLPLQRYPKYLIFLDYSSFRPLFSCVRLFDFFLMCLGKHTCPTVCTTFVPPFVCLYTLRLRRVPSISFCSNPPYFPTFSNNTIASDPPLRPVRSFLRSPPPSPIQ